MNSGGALLLAAGFAFFGDALAQRKPLPEIGPTTYYERATELERARKMPEAIQLYTQAARNGDAKAAYRLGQIYEKGRFGIPANQEESVRWYNAARVLGYPPLVGDFPKK